MMTSKLYRKCCSFHNENEPKLGTKLLKVILLYTLDIFSLYHNADVCLWKRQLPPFSVESSDNAGERALRLFIS